MHIERHPWLHSGVCQSTAAIFHRGNTVDSKTLKHRPRTIYAVVPSSPGFGVGGQSCSNFLESTVFGSFQKSCSPNTDPKW